MGADYRYNCLVYPVDSAENPYFAAQGKAPKKKKKNQTENPSAGGPSGE